VEDIVTTPECYLIRNYRVLLPWILVNAALGILVTFRALHGAQTLSPWSAVIDFFTVNIAVLALLRDQLLGTRVTLISMEPPGESRQTDKGGHRMDFEFACAGARLTALRLRNLEFDTKCATVADMPAGGAGPRVRAQLRDRDGHKQDIESTDLLRDPRLSVVLQPEYLRETREFDAEGGLVFLLEYRTQLGKRGSLTFSRSFKGTFFGRRFER
jgi:hypothetical protein